MILAKTGNEAIAYAMKQINPDVVAAYPITPSTEIVQIFSSYVADGEVDTEFVPVESEHSAMSACIAAAASGARAMTATSAQGLALMHEMLFIASGLRLPIVLCVVNRALSAPLNIHCDHTDSLASRDSGWIQIFCEDAQEAYDTTICAIKIAEKSFLPVMVTIDGFIISHCMQRIEVLSDEEVKSFIGEYKPNYNLLDVENPITLGPACLPDSFFEHKRAQAEGMNQALRYIEEVFKEYKERFNRELFILEEYHTKDAEVGILCMGSTSGTAKIAVDNLRGKGYQVGLFKLRVFRPIAVSYLQRSLKNLKILGILERMEGLSAFGGPLFNEVRSVLYDEPERPIIISYVYGLGGREITPEEIEEVFLELLSLKNKKRENIEKFRYINVR
ncbi:MAG: pyruvate ferredoxin oxidoreductase [candidate division WOR-3 bacterium]|nr:pyruvate ferredoxin oxidoreductase [candidate division WOR-3 bacterium]MCX7836588.1 pyruvate ferredoxin oxidoreductase [candidate division WOR-3 bacterium]MDW8114160.1 pyruvate ferredoxin oxidoreductase [candidate division WOR-3 bacterium]